MLEITTVNKGAELVSVKLNGEEKLHDGLSFWNRHSPVLFPIVGKIKNGETVIEGTTYKMGQHGFARDMEFEKIGDNSYVLKSNELTKERFPYDFEFYLWYEVNENTITTNYKVVNKDNRTMFFGLGAHPAFKCDYNTEKYSLKFEENENDIEVVQLENGLISDEKIDSKKFVNDKEFFLRKTTFENDAVIMKNIKSNKIYLEKENEKILEFDFTGFPYLAVWSKPEAPFICIEPWFNTADKVNSDGIFKNKENILKLEARECFEAKYSVKFF